MIETDKRITARKYNGCDNQTWIAAEGKARVERKLVETRELRDILGLNFEQGT